MRITTICIIIIVFIIFVIVIFVTTICITICIIIIFLIAITMTIAIQLGARIKMSKANDFYPGTNERVCLVTGDKEAVTEVTHSSMTMPMAITMMMTMPMTMIILMIVMMNGTNEWVCLGTRRLSLR